MGPREVKAFCRIDREGEKLLETAVTRLGFSARAYDRSLTGQGENSYWYLRDSTGLARAALTDCQLTVR